MHGRVSGEQQEECVIGKRNSWTVHARRSLWRGKEARSATLAQWCEPPKTQRRPGGRVEPGRGGAHVRGRMGLREKRVVNLVFAESA